jgi:hypothetical protein
MKNMRLEKYLLFVFMILAPIFAFCDPWGSQRLEMLVYNIAFYIFIYVCIILFLIISLFTKKLIYSQLVFFGCLINILPALELSKNSESYLFYWLLIPPFIFSIYKIWRGYSKSK